MFQQLIEISHRAFAEGNYNASYHALAAALHCAIKEDNDQQAAQVEAIAKEQLNWIDERSPEYEHSSQSAAKRGHQSIFTLLAHQSATRSKLIRHE